MSLQQLRWHLVKRTCPALHKYDEARFTSQAVMGVTCTIPGCLSNVLVCNPGNLCRRYNRVVSKDILLAKAFVSSDCRQILLNAGAAQRAAVSD